MSHKIYRHEYAIGDVQGCFSALERLLKHIGFDTSKDRLWFAGDIVARGEDSLATLRLIKQLNAIGCAETVLGNHDLNILAVWRGFAKIRGKDHTENVLEAKDCDDLMHWLRKQPLIHLPNEHTILSHAGIPHIWSSKKAISLAHEVEAILSADLKTLDTYLPQIYGKEPTLWEDTLTAGRRFRCITSYLTRMRLCTSEGKLDFDYKINPIKHKDDLPHGYKPWYAWQKDYAQERKRKVLFGHWAALEAKVENKRVRSLDAGCVWDGHLLAYRLDDAKVFKVDA